MSEIEDKAQTMQQKLEHLLDRLQRFRTDHPDRALELVKECTKWLNARPLSSEVYIHVIGAAKALKTSYLLDLYDWDDLRDLIAVPEATAADHTAVPCLFMPTSEVKEEPRFQLARFSDLDRWSGITKEEFRHLYSHKPDSTSERYMLRILLPKDRVRNFSLPVIEYPGMQSEAAAEKKRSDEYLRLAQDMIEVMAKMPGIIVACFSDKFSIPEGHALHRVLEHYHKLLSADGRYKLPLVISMQGAVAVQRFCGQTPVVEEIKQKFKEWNKFDTRLQLVNPSHKNHSVRFGPRDDRLVTEWMKEFSNYGTFHEVEPLFGESGDGGIAWSRRLLRTLCEETHTRQAVLDFFLHDWIERCEQFLQDAQKEIERWSTDWLRDQTRKAIQEKLAHDPHHYKSIRFLFEERCNVLHDKRPPNDIAEQEKFWLSLLTSYLKQFFTKPEHAMACDRAAAGIWRELLAQLDPDKQGFMATRKHDAALIILNIAAVYVPNALLRGDKTIYGEFSHD